MPISKNIKANHIISAIEFIDKHGVADHRESTKYVVVYNEKHYPPKYVISISNKYANGTELEPSEFSGGVESNNFLKRLGFIVVEEITNNKSGSILEGTLKQVLLPPMDNELSYAYNDFKKCFINNQNRKPYEVWEFKVSKRGYMLAIRDNEEEKHFPFPFQHMQGENSTRLAAYEYFILKYGKTFFADLKEITICSYNPNRSNPLSRRYHSSEEYLAFIPKLDYGLHQIADLQEIMLDIEGERWEYESRLEGSVSFNYGKKYERDLVNRIRAISIHGVSCTVCGFNFEKVYGNRGKDFIEVHHRKPLSTLGGVEVEVNPETDLVPLCSNCHRMIHRRHNDVLTIEQLKSMVEINGTE